ncbi:DUF4185 domain-containing protein [Pedobacter chinensis]|uniref:DUF4185 domain-containing protein n=1 Tax=Pedobacter chinensis TaxID=2282421 RepID=A0A369Q324_9SPHI|nr:DUF4185 domain-containing protein [Pedobacter chinensis]RDC57855.1 DUF4185 domain-containing protein [Pedobacter chinensis]
MINIQLQNLLKPFSLSVLILFGISKINFAQNQTKELQLNNIQKISRLTGTPLKGEQLPSPNNTAEQYDVGGTDLGIFWQMEGSKVGIFFGDTHGREFIAEKDGKGGGNGANWRSNVLAFSSDDYLEDGIKIDSMALDDQGSAREICAGGKTNPQKYNTSIPTAAIRVKNIDYVHYMNIYDWAGGNGRWLTNFSSIYTSADNGKTWTRRNEITFKGDSKFSQVCYAKKDGYVLMIGSLSGRGGPGYLARIKEKNMLNLNQYEYWNSNLKKWIKGDESKATIIIPGPIGEASLLYHEKYKRWIIAYSYDSAYDPNVKDKFHAIVYRDAKNINGTWSDLKILASEKEFKGLYCPYIYPLKNKSDKLYFTMSQWEPYNVYLMTADISTK